MSAELPDKKYSVYIALIGLIGISIYDLTNTGNLEASKEIVLALLAFAGGRQLMKSFLNK